VTQNRVSIDDIRREVESLFGDLIIDLGDGSSVRLRNGLRLPEDRRRTLEGLQKQLDSVASGDDLKKTLVEIIRTVAEDGQADRLLTVFSDPASLLAIVRLYGTRTQLGEASRSAV